MRNKWIKRFFPIIALVLLAPWPVAYAYDYTNGPASQNAVQIETAEASAQPTWQVVGKTISGVTPGDLFYIDATNNGADIQTTLYITNTQELVHNYRNLILKIGVYAETSSGEWEQVPADTFITMLNGLVSFDLQGMAKYKLTIDSGSFYCTTTNAEGGSLSPNFFLEVD